MASPFPSPWWKTRPQPARGTLIADAYASYNGVHPKDRQSCLSHIKTKAKELEQELALKRLVVLKVEDFPIMRHWYVVHRTDKRLSPVAQAFKEFVLGQARG